MNWLKHLIVSAILLSLLIANNSAAETKVIFNDEVFLYNALAFCEGHKEKSEILEKQNILYVQQLQIFEDQLQSCNSTLSTTLEVSEQAKPGFFRTLLNNTLFVLTGVGIGLLL